jgi:CheY-like chemotaxis protein
MKGLHGAGRGRDSSVQDLPTVLVVEDDQLVQSMVEEALSDGGFEITAVATGEEAITLLKGKQTAYRALVTDIHLAGKPDGWDVARAAREIDPAFPIVYMTGAAADEWGSKGVPNSVLISKPFAPVQLVTAVSHLLNASPPTAPTE